MATNFSENEIVARPVFEILVKLIEGHLKSLPCADTKTSSELNLPSNTKGVKLSVSFLSSASILKSTSIVNYPDPLPNLSLKSSNFRTKVSVMSSFY